MKKISKFKLAWIVSILCIVARFIAQFSFESLINFTWRLNFQILDKSKIVWLYNQSWFVLNISLKHLLKPVF